MPLEGQPGLDSEAQGIMVVDLALELRRRAKVFAKAGDSARAKKLWASSAEQLETATSYLRASRLLDVLQTLLEVWQRLGLVPEALIADQREAVLAVELEALVAEALQEVAKVPAVAAAVAELAVAGCNAPRESEAPSQPSTFSGSTGRSSRTGSSPPPTGLLSAAASAAAEARANDDDDGSILEWDAGSSRPSSGARVTPPASPPPDDLEVAWEPPMMQPPRSRTLPSQDVLPPPERVVPEPPFVQDSSPPKVVVPEMPAVQDAPFAKEAASSTKEVEVVPEVFGGSMPSSPPRAAGGSRPRFCLCPGWPVRGRTPASSVQRSQLRLSVDFQRGDLLGAGSYGCVFAARRNTSGELVAVKEMLLDRVPQSGQERGDRLVKLTRELRLCEQLEHPYIVRYLGHEFVMGSQGGPEKLHLFLEYCSGGCLAAQLRTYGPLREELIRKYTQQLVTGLAYLHSRSPPVVHRDLKCANVLLTHNGDAKLSDFGCSKLLSPNETVLENSVAGSIFWMAPELLKGKGKLTTSADVWSLGCCVLEMATGAAPWSERRFDNILQACHVIANSEELPTFPADLPDAAAAFIVQCLRREPQNRPTPSDLNNSKLLKNVR
eukprot:TRINITY_DN22984_c0_g1_i1.p1 TRINITY_DN22984_c0_g1~~TRINITY_DN22984_c0_g1_i1.p1  ORF type:complete len:644 (-),score=124.02 TRINITY_DN22984_c0_g1_i1:57-1880(-)